jgi:pimeloyl-ACP methyl ester carboxylesterase
MAMPDQPLRLRDGRALGWAEYGDPNGQPVFCFINNNSRRFYPFDNSIAAALNLRLLAVERPGIGLSDPKPNRTLLDWPDDIGELADALKVDRFSVVGVSEGGPYAAACAFKLRKRVAALSLVSSFAPPEAAARRHGVVQRIESLIARRNDVPPPLSHEARRQNSVKAWQNFHQRLPECDKEMIRQFGPRYLKPAFMRDVYDELYRQGLEGVMQDEALLTGLWGFDLAGIVVPTCLWHGEADTAIPVRAGRYLAKEIPNCRAHFLAHEGHLLYLKHWREILVEMVE